MSISLMQMHGGYEKSLYGKKKIVEKVKKKSQKSYKAADCFSF